MTSMYGSDLTPYDHSFTYRVPDLPAKNNKLTFTSNSLIDLISKEPQFSRFFFMIKLGSLASMLDSYTSTYTIFVPTDDAFPFTDDVLINMDKYVAKETVLYHILPMKAPLSVLQSSNGMYLEPKINSSINCKIMSKLAANGTIVLNSNSNIVQGNIKATNGLIHVIDRILIPPPFKNKFGDYLETERINVFQF